MKINWKNVFIWLFLTIMIALLVTFLFPGPELFWWRNGTAFGLGLLLGQTGPNLWENKNGLD